MQCIAAPAPKNNNTQTPTFEMALVDHNQLLLLTVLVTAHTDCLPA
jgi:hypothetical protein